MAGTGSEPRLLGRDPALKTEISKLLDPRLGGREEGVGGRLQGSPLQAFVLQCIIGRLVRVNMQKIPRLLIDKKVFGNIFMVLKIRIFTRPQNSVF